jgi:hypothetical protein
MLLELGVTLAPVPGKYLPVLDLKLKLPVKGFEIIGELHVHIPFQPG